MTVHLDISQLVLDPRRSGIQRSERELIRHWPGPGRLVPCRLDPFSGEMQALPEAVFEVLCADAPAGGVEAELRALRPLLRRGRPVRPERLLSAELFLDPVRAAYYRASTARTYWLVYDFLPWLQPNWFSVGSAARLMPYLQALRAVSELAFISARTRDDCALRVLRRACPGPVLPLGGDGLGLEAQAFDRARRSFVMLGTIEPRKNAAPAMRAFQLLWKEGVEAELVMIGATSPDAAEELGLIAALRDEPRFRLLRGLADAGVRDELRRARAMLFPSEGEGYGIPPMEALHSGIPVVVHAGLPALAGQAGWGQVRLEVADAEAIAAAVLGLMDDAAAARLWAEAGRLHVPGWRAFAAAVAGWVQA